MKYLRNDLHIRRNLYIKQLTKHSRSIAVIGLSLVVLVCGSALASYSRAEAGNLGQATPLSLNQWTNLGPDAGITSLAIHPTEPNIIYAGGRSGLFKSTDGGASWKNTGLTNVSALVIDYTNPNIIFAGTDGNSSAPGASLWKSTNGGTTWSDSKLIDWDISLLVMDPVSPTILYAGSGVRYSFEGGIVLWKTTDGGGRWDGSRDSHGGLAYYGWAINPAEPQTIYAPGDLYANGQMVDSGLFKSTDGGASWNSTRLVHSSVSAVAIDFSNPDTLYAGTTANGSDDFTFRDLLKSTDAGESWLAINNGLGRLLGTSSRISSLVIDPFDPNTLYAGTYGRGVFRSTDGGAIWSEFNPGLTNLSITKLAIDASGKHLYAVTNLGVFDYQFVTPCAEPLSDDRQSFESGGGSGSVNVTAANECGWTAKSYADWITVSPDSRGGSGTLSYTVTPNRSASPRVGTIEIAARFLTVTQAGAPLRITGLTVSGKKLLVAGEGFDPGAVILINGKEQNTKNDTQNPNTIVIGKKAGKRVKAGDRVQVRNPDGSLSDEFTFIG